MSQRSLVVPTVFLQAVVLLFGSGVLAFLLWEPHIEGRNANATLWEIYFQDPFLAYVLVASTPLFLALVKGFQVLGYFRQRRAFSPVTGKALRTIRLCAVALIGLAVVGELLLLLSPSDDRAGGLFIGLLITGVASVIAAAAATLERVLQPREKVASKGDVIA